MGLNSRGAGGGSNTTFLNVYQGNIVIEYDEQDKLLSKLDSLGLDPEGVKVRQRTKGKNEGKDVFYYVLFDVSGLLTNVTIKELPFGEFVELEITDVDEKFVVSLGDVTGRIAKDFARKCGGIDLSSELVLLQQQAQLIQTTTCRSNGKVWETMGRCGVRFALS
jgi:hypothetical protein